MKTLGVRIHEAAVRRGGETALLWEGQAFGFSHISERAARVSSGMVAASIRPGDRVAVGLPNSPELVVAALGVLYAGAVLVPLNPAATPEEAAYVLNDSGARWLITHRAQAEAVRGRASAVGRVVVDLAECFGPLREPARGVAEGPALIVYTSGTTGAPKGVVLSHRALSENLATVAAAWRWTPADRLLLTLPCFHLHGLALGIIGSLLVGSAVVLRPRFVAEAVPADIAGHRITLFFGVPTMYNRLVALPDESLRGQDLSSMRLWVCGSAPLTESTFNRFEARFGHRILERYGMSEGGFMIAAPYEGPRRAGVVGRALRGIDVRIVDSNAADGGRLRDVAGGEAGELVIRGSNLFSGYWRRPAETAAAFVDGFFRSGDLAVREADGMIRIVGRRSIDIIKTRGFKVSAVEVENQLQNHPAVREVAVVGLPDADQGKRVVAVVTPTPGASLTPDDLRAFARERLAPHKVPADIILTDEIPRTGPGKFNKKLLIERLSH